MRTPPGRIVAASSAAFLLLACSHGGGSVSSGAGSGFRLARVDLAPSGVQELDRRITFTFNRALDFASVTTTTFALRDQAGMPVSGELWRGFGNERQLVFQPTCPLAPDLSDASFRLGERYTIDLAGLDSPSGATLSSASGAPLAASAHFEFVAPADVADAFFDWRPGAPRALVRPFASLDTKTSYVELGHDPQRRLYFETDGSNVTLAPAQALPLNLASAAETGVVFVLAFDQTIDPSAENLARVRLEFRGASGTWKPLWAIPYLVDDCGEYGATLRVQPLGILPPDAEVRVVLDAGFSDRVGEAHAVQLADFALAHVAPAPAVLADELAEEFASVASDGWSAAESGVRARWSGGRLSAEFELGIEGNAGEAFDWQVAQGEVLLFDTNGQTLIGGPDFVATTTVDSRSGVIEARDVRIGVGATLRATGPHPLVILATGDVTIDGTLDVSGFSSMGPCAEGNGGNYGTYRGPSDGLPSGSWEPEYASRHADGACGGGAGGGYRRQPGWYPERGELGEGAFGSIDGGGQGGAGGWSTTWNWLSRRGAGGGGGRFGPDVLAPGSSTLFDQRSIGLDAEDGFANKLGQGSATGDPFPLGGSAGSSPLVDGDPSNDFFGAAVDETSGARMIGELAHPWAGQGGGSGGNAYYSLTFPPANPGAQIGGGGGGGGGSVRIVALGRIRIGPQGRILARGGLGSGGGNTLYLNRVGGGGGGGSGGHVILESARQVVFDAPWPAAQIPIRATGGQGGAGGQDLGGACFLSEGPTETVPSLDACPDGYPTSGVNACRGHIDGAGGDGGPGIVQIHAPNGIADVVLPAGKTLADLCQPPALCDWGPRHLEPSVGLHSRAISKWYALGNGGFDAASGAVRAPVVELGNIDPATGRVNASEGVATPEAPIYGPSPLQTAPSTPTIAHGGHALVIDAAGWLGGVHERYLERPSLLVRNVVRLTDANQASLAATYDIVFAERVSLSTTLTVWVDLDGPSLSDFAGLAPLAALHPAFVRVSSDGALDRLNRSAAVKLRFQAAAPDAFGAPGEVSAFSSDAAALNAWIAIEGAAFLRFEADLDVLAEPGAGPTRYHVPAIEFLRIPFRY